MFIDCKERVEAYFNNMNKYKNDLDIKVRFLDKIFKASIDENYTNDEHVYVLRKLLNQSKNESDIEYKILDLCYCFKINKIINANLEIPIIRSKDTIKATLCFDGNMPKDVYEKLQKREGQLTIKFANSLKPDKEILELFNVEIAQDHFYKVSTHALNTVI